ncbi:hypothetical protein AGDE_10920 [Angomonas deanei]|uniref:Uncharacterized protein n=1 Tax=Angomonas deanei TaxID=59799 RepID=A0A7G2CPR0_9TRYP|nr:hypothetical protein AGDE_10920 [Angomonas deanei]CAD2220533.1 hypothetical protein, conserved [Angomonas deanei]|eukprot:EPY27129.1 hypothetical protein AGDE_10920 [Angomonas deanei]
MSSHFNNVKTAEKRLSLSYLLSKERPLTPGEIRFRNHGYFRGAVLLFMVTYFVYCNPDYSWEYTAMREYFGWDKKPPMFPQILKLAEKPRMRTLYQQETEPEKKE